MESITNERKVVLLAGPGTSTNILYHALDKQFEISRVIIEQPVSRVELAKRRAKRLGYRAAAGQILFSLLAVPFLSVLYKDRIQDIQSLFQLDTGEIPADRMTNVKSVNSEHTLRLLQELEPDVIIVNGTRIISESVLNKVSSTFINMHMGITPLYRGVHGAFWALYQRDIENCGVTVHLIDPGIDTGGIIYQGRIAPEKEDSFVTYPYLQIAVGLPLMVSAINDIITGKLSVKSPPMGTSRLFYHPTLVQYLQAVIRWGIK